MDTSETYRESIVNPLEPLERVEVAKWYNDPIYIKMCEKAEEIQEQWEPAMGDWVMVKEKVEWDGYRTCVEAGEVTVVLGIDERGYSENPIVGDVDDIAFYPECSWKSFNDTPKENLIWLPRQDQLQEMMFLAWPEFYPDEMIKVFAEYCDEQPKYSDFVDRNIPTMEQLWLAFVMFKLYQKTWSDGEWITTKR